MAEIRAAAARVAAAVQAAAGNKFFGTFNFLEVSFFILSLKENMLQYAKLKLIVGGYMENNLEVAKKLCEQNKLRWTAHIMMKILQRGISVDDVKEAISTGEIIEEYPNDYPYPSCLLVGKNFNGQFLHVVFGFGENELWLITAYKPSAEKWEVDFKTRKEETP